MTWRVEPLEPDRHERGSFTSGAEALDRYLPTQATQDARRRVAATFCLVDTEEPTAVAGYYTLAAGAVRLIGLPPDLQKRLPRYPDVPVYLLGRLAVHLRQQGRGLGTRLIRDALRRVLKQDIPGWAVVVDAIDDAAVVFYERHGFRAFPHERQRLLLPVSAIRREVAETIEP